MNKTIELVLVMVVMVAALAGNVNAAWLTKDGRANAEIVVAPAPPRLVKLAAEELQAYVKKMSGAELSIVTNSGTACPVKIYVGRSVYTDKLGVTDAGLKNDGSYRIKSDPDLPAGAGYLVLMGYDFDFQPPALFGRKDVDAQAEWDKMTRDRTDSAWGYPLRSLSRSYNTATDTWHQDQSGSLNAVYEFLRLQGVRWYMPGELGEVVPRRATLALPAVDLETSPDFPVRRFFGPAYFVMSRDDLLWGLRLGLNQGYPVLGSGAHVHGLHTLYSRPEMKAKHPEYFALIGGLRCTNGAGQACFSSEGFTRETVNYVRAMFDLLDEPTVDLWPGDGNRKCECDKCVNQSPAELVFGFVDRVAREVVKTHPDRMITCGAYAGYRLPPTNITSFPPNVGITIAFPRPGLDRPETWGRSFNCSYNDLIFGWRDKTTSGWIMGNSNYRGPALITRSIAADLRARKGKSVGDWNEVGHISKPGDTRGGRATGRQTWKLGIHHLNLYVNACLLWNADQDLDALLDDYYTNFYGPVAAQIKNAFEFAEANYARGQGAAALSLVNQIKLTEMLQAAREKAGDTIYGQRIAYILDEEKSLDELRAELQAENEMNQIRGKAPLVVGRDRAAGGETAQTYSLVDLTTGETPPVATEFNMEWDHGTLVFDIRCSEPDMDHLYVTRDVWGGDSVAILVETPFHAYYQMEINPDGDMAEADREYGRVNQNWKSLAEVETERGADFWRIKARIPVMNEAAGVLDPLHNVVGEKPSVEAPWFIQVGRVRIRDFKKAAYGLTATGGTYHKRERFGRLVIE